MHHVLGNGAVIVKATTPAKLNGGVSNVPHHQASRGTWRTCTERQGTLGQKSASNLSQLDPAWIGSRWGNRGQERLGGRLEDGDRGELWVVMCLRLGGSQRLSIEGCIDFSALNLELLSA